MWTVKGKTTAGKDVSYNVPTAKDTDKAIVLALAFQQHGQADAGDPLTPEATVEWSSDSVLRLETPVQLKTGSNYGVDRRVKKGVWERHSTRAYRSMEAAEEAMESAASEFPNDRFRIVETLVMSRVISVTKNAFVLVGEEPDPEPLETPKEETSKEAPKAKPTPKTKAA